MMSDDRHSLGTPAARPGGPGGPGGPSDGPARREEPRIALPTVMLAAVTIAAGGVAAGLWVGGAAVLGYEADVRMSGAIGAGLAALCAAAGLLLSMPWIAKPASTAMLLWLVADVFSMAVSLGGAYLLYSATFLGPRSGPPMLLGVVLGFFLVLLSKAAALALHMRGQRERDF